MKIRNCLKVNVRLFKKVAGKKTTTTNIHSGTKRLELKDQPRRDDPKAFRLCAGSWYQETSEAMKNDVTWFVPEVTVGEATKQTPSI